MRLTIFLEGAEFFERPVARGGGGTLGNMVTTFLITLQEVLEKEP